MPVSEIQTLVSRLKSFGGGFKLKLFNIEFFIYFIHQNILQRIDLSVRIFQDGGGG